MICLHCGSKITLVANVCPYCTRDLGYGPSGIAEAIGLLLMVGGVAFFLICNCVGIKL